MFKILSCKRPGQRAAALRSVLGPKPSVCVTMFAVLLLWPGLRESALPLHLIRN